MVNRALSDDTGRRIAGGVASWKIVHNDAPLNRLPIERCMTDRATENTETAASHPPAVPRGSAGKRQASTPAEPASSPTPAEPSEERKAHERRFRCLHCGYALMSENGFRCSECGREHERYVLERWFWGKEENRLERVLWLVRACVFLKLWVFEYSIMALASTASSAAVLWACWQAGQGKRDTVGWQYAVAGMVVAGLSLLSTVFGAFGLGAFGLGAAAIVTLDIVSACLLLTAMLRDADRQELWREPTGSRIALGILLAAPLLGIVFAMFESGSGVFGFSSSLGISGKLSNFLPGPIRFLIPRVAALAVWLFVWYWLAGLKRAMFGQAQHE